MGRHATPGCRGGVLSTLDLDFIAQCTFDRTFDVLTRALELLCLALGFQLVIVGRLANRFLDIAGNLVSGSTDLVHKLAHFIALYHSESRSAPKRNSAVPGMFRRQRKANVEPGGLDCQALGLFRLSAIEAPKLIAGDLDAAAFPKTMLRQESCQRPINGLAVA